MENKKNIKEIIKGWTRIETIETGNKPVCEVDFNNFLKSITKDSDKMFILGDETIECYIITPNSIIKTSQLIDYNEHEELLKTYNKRGK